MYYGRTAPRVLHPEPFTLSAEDPDLPTHTISRIEDRERLLAEAMAHAEALEEQYKVIPADPAPRGRWKTPAASAIFALALVVAFVPPSWLAGREAPRPTVGDMDRGLRVSMLLQAQQVEAFRVREGRLPEHLSELPVTFPGLDLVRSNNRVYQIRGRRADGSVEIYDSSQPSPVFAHVAPWAGRPAP